RSVHTRFTVIASDGKVLGDSDENPDLMEYHGDRPEVRQALGGSQGIHRRYSRTVKQEMMYIAVPLKNENGEILCAVRAALPMTAIKGELNKMTSQVVVAALVTGLLAMAVCIVVVRRITAPLLGMSSAARKFAEGDFNHRIPAQQAVELDLLAESLNTMSEQLNKTLSTLSEQRNEQQAVLSSMDEGVLAIDRRERIIHMNRVAGEILGVDHTQVKRKLIQQVIRFSNLQEFSKAVLGSQKPISMDLTLIGKTEKQIQAHGTVLRNAADESIGALIVLRDVTHIRHLETVRADFVANVSHELKTPITSIKGFVETLLSDDWNHEPDILRFLEIINQQSGRLNAIIDDLLTLSRLEQKEGHVQKVPSELAAVINNAIYLCQLQAAKKNIAVTMECPGDLALAINAPLLEQALVNLIINAIKYSEPDKPVRIAARKLPGKVEISVKDEGFGIEHKHLERLFERFYRVDTARSRKLGGTGLGLSIVKHIVQVHEGSIRVESKLGIGSTFIISLPDEA
ncbi:MAG: cell wall metabolism sensor histidine kinase WalK, partial [Kiritimatiellales bacterium]|nr:cell wall metabolism sensor histidine kinase WalK [Kiritimatiellales bacterium]